SRPTVSRMAAEARRKVADALLHGKRLLIATEPSATVGEEAEDAASPEARILKSASSPASAEPETSPCATPAHGHSQDATGDSPAQG
ncbi:hypothetical protein RZS08_09190, partial [Arthrospira platensis SPKY1]|nr:hypothetical protein [Arthrospira platensis SPKY1]